ncbi:MAG: FHA domain-containing protein [Dehalococcoidia bacterium]
MKCPSCGKENPASEQYCLDCGSDLSAAPAASTGMHATATPAGATPAAGGAPAQSVAMSDEEFQRLLNSPPGTQKCPHCGADAPAGGTFCDNCGESLAATPAGATSGASAAAAPAATMTPAPVAPPPTTPADPALDATRPIEPPAASGPTTSFEYAGPTASGTYAMTGDEAKIGRRDADAGIYPELDFDGNDLVVDAGERVHAVSRRHGRIFRDNGELKFEDLGSTNGTTLNGAAVLAHDPQPLKDGDKLVLGRTCRITVHAG